MVVVTVESLFTPNFRYAFTITELGHCYINRPALRFGSECSRLRTTNINEALKK